jgi:hypothetical protein
MRKARPQSLSLYVSSEVLSGQPAGMRAHVRANNRKVSKSGSTDQNLNAYAIFRAIFLSFYYSCTGLFGQEHGKNQVKQKRTIMDS